MNFKIAIVDDSQPIREFVASVIEKDLKEKHVEYDLFQYSDSESFLDSNRLQEMDILILDIELPNMNGVTLSKEIRKMNQNIIIIFLTSYEHYVRDAFGLNVYQYILKSESEKRLPEALTQVISLLESKQEKRLTFKTISGTASVMEEEIVCFLYDNRRTYLITTQDKIKLSPVSLKDLLTDLNQSLFIQPHSGSIVNLKHVRKMDKKEIVLNYFDETIPISRRRHSEVQERYTNFLMLGDSL